jgi:hypothetical protein
MNTEALTQARTQADQKATELEILAERLENFAQRAREAQETLDSTREKTLQGDAQAEAHLSQAQQEATSRAELLREIQSRHATAEAELAELRAAEANQEKYAELRTLCEQAKFLADEMAREYGELDQLLTTRLQSIESLETELAEAQSEAMSLFQALAPRTNGSVYRNPPDAQAAVAASLIERLHADGADPKFALTDITSDRNESKWLWDHFERAEDIYRHLLVKTAPIIEQGLMMIRGITQRNALSSPRSSGPSIGADVLSLAPGVPGSTPAPRTGDYVGNFLAAQANGPR